MKNNIINNLFFYTVIIILCLVMIYFINKKEGFHADEMFSYGSSNYNYDNLFQPYGDRDYINKFISGNIKNIKDLTYYIFNPHVFMDKVNEIKNNEIPIWKTKQDALEYMTIQSDELFNFFSIYYNQSRDAHPPLFYYLVHIVSSAFINHFSKYIIFIINIIAFIGVNIIIKKILELMEKKYLAIPTIILYGMSIGAISTVMFQRMYMLLAFFITYYSYLAIKLIKNNYVLSKELKLKMGIITILGFLTHYYFCLYVAIFVLLLGIQIYKKYGKKEFIKLVLYYIKLAIIGIIIFPASIYHIFFSYRGVGAISNNSSILDFFNLVFEAYGLNIVLGWTLIILISIIVIIKMKKEKDTINITLFFTIIGFIISTSKISPYLEMRYIMGILPIISFLFWINIDYLLKYLRKPSIIIISIFITIFYTFKLKYYQPLYLYPDYKKNIEIASENYDKKFIYIEDNGYNHIQSMPEFMIYEKSFIINIENNELKYLKNNSELIGEKSFIVSIKKYMNVNEIIKKISELTKYENYINLLNGTENYIYEFYK